LVQHSALLLSSRSPLLNRIGSHDSGLVVQSLAKPVQGECGPVAIVLLWVVAECRPNQLVHLLAGHNPPVAQLLGQFPKLVATGLPLNEDFERVLQAAFLLEFGGLCLLVFECERVLVALLSSDVDEREVTQRVHNSPAR
jgi:hypothetical protein